MSEKHCDICGEPLTETEARWGTCDDCEAVFEESREGSDER